MATKKTNNARLVPFIIMSLLTLIFLIWAMQQCGQDDGDYAMIAEREARETYIDTMRRAEQERQIQAQINAEAEARAAALLRARTQPLPGDSVVRMPAAEVVVEKVTTLYSTINGLNVRSGPSLKNGKIARLGLYDEVEFAGEVTDSLYTIDLGEVSPTAPWVKVKLKDGKEGWVFGAGVSYYKYQLKGVITD
ncbi:SH3 domain-containing protein [Neolewinella aurantiaca]|uniref:SH3 domain-containing protein n=1 Tax=Neolewinella aurantiaca TaxID=2602767 RepID=A0A5C7FG82_9BACT|nr:SH3 domain-containing protein [Neolewinella aurantiaca]TXF88710.1 SH3 domain-containing protein [Neolewinella aurantiaca]